MNVTAPIRLRQSLGTRLALAYASFFLVSTVALFAVAYLLLASSLQDRDRALIEGEVGEFAAELAEGGCDSLRAEVENASNEPGAADFAVRLVSPDGEVLLSAPETLWEDYAVPEVVDVAPGTWNTIGGAGDTPPLDVTATATRRGTLYVGAPGARHEVLDRFRALFALILIPVLVLGFGGGLVLARRALTPLRSLAATVDRVATTGRLGERVPQRGSGDELDALAGLVNGMLTRVEALVGGMRGTLDNAAHDLRTPLTRLRAGAERALLDRPGPPDPVLSDVVEETDSLLAMLNAIMDVAEAEAGTLTLQREPTDLTGLVAQVTDVYDLVADETGVSLAVEPSPPLVVSVDAARVRQAVANLVDNALKYTPSGGHVAVFAGEVGGQAVIAVTDDGPGVPMEDVPRIWDRLYRGDKSRSKRGLGLGLSVVRAVAEAHGGDVSVAEVPGGGTRFTLRIPLRASNGAD